MAVRRSENPSLTDTPQVLAGTYVAEQRTEDTYDLMALRRLRAPPESTKAQFKRKVASQTGRVQCTVLPVLNTLESLYAATHAQDARRLSDSAVSPPAETKNTVLQRALRRLYPGRNSILPGENLDYLDLVPSDEEFRRWLTFPPRAPVGYSRASSSLPPIVDVGKSAAESDMSDQEAKGFSQPSWVLLLLRSTFEEPGNDPERVAAVIISVLDLDEASAQAMVRRGEKRPFLVF
mmetsp:Transcript_14995/g.38526  ORF Transcript_14995/g.38526 Transcript_14995/m.38526 type:complete len:235 (+) Transcript_14995:199-903(+)